MRIGKLNSTIGRSRSAPRTHAAQPRHPRAPAIVTWLIWGLVAYSTVPLTIFDQVGADVAQTAMPSEGTALSKIIWLTLLGLGAALSLSRSGTVLKLMRQINPFLLIFFGLAAASLLWSIEPEITAKRVITASAILLDAFALAATSADPKRFQSVLRPVITFILIGSIVFVITAPLMAITQSDQPELVGAWHGLMSQKNGFGSLAAIGFVLWLHAYLSQETARWRALVGLTVSAICLVGSRSSTSLMATVFASSLMFMLLRSPRGLRRYLPYLIAVFASLLLVYSLAVLNLIPGSDLLLSPITSLTGKDQTFSGRTAIWAVLNEHVALSPWFGSGFGAYWVQIPTSPSMLMLQRLYFYPTEGHNGYLDVINDLGIAGAICLVSYLIVFLRQSLRILSVLRPQGALYLTLLFEQLIGNLSESRWFNALDFDFVIMTLATVAIARTLREMRLSAQSAGLGR